MKFKRIYVEITNQCNLTCDFCAQSTRPKRFMSTAEFQLICEQIRFFTEHIYLHVQGEPLLHPQLKEILHIAKSFDFKVQLVTNGTLIDEKLDILLNSSAIRQISISLQSIQTIGYIEDYDKRNRLFNQMIELSNVNKIIQLRLWNYNDQVFTDGVNACLSFFDINKNDFSIEKKRYPTNHKNIFFSLDKQFQWPSDPSIQSMIGTCYGTRSMVGILSDGTLVPCCLDQDGAIALGNVFTIPFRQLMQQQRLLDMQSGFSKHVIIEPFCQHCQYRSRFD
jgi:radical SAM protein with 4Fe4S-binding SPASM domain